MATLQCTRCGNTKPHVYLRDRRPHGHQVYCACDECGARNWEADASQPWAGVRYVEQPVAPRRWKQDTRDYRQLSAAEARALGGPFGRGGV